MAQTRDALRFSEYFEVDATDLDDYGAYDVPLDRDDRLLIDPKLLDYSAVPEMESAYSDIHEHFRLIMRLLVRSWLEGDASWRAALRMFRFPEFRAAGLGYSRNSTSATEAASAILWIAFTTLALYRVWATCDTRNVGSWRVMEKLGLRREAEFRADAFQKGQWRDSYLYAMLEGDKAVNNLVKGHRVNGPREPKTGSSEALM